MSKKVLKTVCDKNHHNLTFLDILMGGASIDAYGEPLTKETIEIANAMMGKVG